MTASTILDLIANYDGHLVGASRTGSGKTRLMLSTIAHIKDGTEWLCASGKGSVWMGLEDQTGKDNQPRVLNCSLSSPETIEPLLHRLRWAIALQEQRETIRLRKTKAGEKVNPQPIRIVLDEWLILLKVAKKHSKEAYAELIDLVEAIVLKGRQDKVYSWLFAQGHSCGTLHLDGDLRANLGVIALGGDGNYQSISSAITDHNLIEDSGDRKKLQAEYQDLIADDSTGRIFYTSIGGHQVGRMINLPDMEQESLFAADTHSKPRSVDSLGAEPVGVAVEEKVSERDRLEDLFEKSPSAHEPEDFAQELLNRQIDLQQDQLELEKTKLRLNIELPSINAEDRWNLITLTVGLLVFLIYVLPPVSGALQGAWKGVVAVKEATESVTQKVDNVFGGFAPDLKASPKKGDKIANYLVTSPFGKRDAPVAGASTFHKGVDLGTPKGVAVYAIAEPGKDVDVKCWEDKNGGGGNVATYESLGLKFQYLHLSNCQSGKSKAGQVIARTGDSGTGSGAHLHFEQIKGGEKVNPEKGYIWWALTGEKPAPVVSRSEAGKK